MAKVYEVAFKLAGRLSPAFTKSFWEGEKLMRSFTERTKNLDRQAAAMAGLEKLSRDVALADRKYISARAAVTSLGREMRSGVPVTREMRVEFQRAEQAVRTAKKALDQKRSSLVQTRQATGMMGASLQTVISREKELAAAAEASRAALERLAAVRKRLSAASAAQEKMSAMRSNSVGAIVSTTAAAAGSVGLPVREAIKLEDAMAEVRKVVDFESPDGLADLQRRLQEMSLSIPMTADQLAKIAAAAGQSGIAEKDLAAFTAQAARMGVAFDISAEASGEMMAKWQSGMGLSLERTYALADAVNYLSNNNAAQAKQIGEVLKRYGALGKLSGLTETHIAAFASTVIASGAEAEVAATGIKAFMRAMSKGGSMSEMQKAAFKNAGLDPKQLQKNLLKDAPKTILETLEAIQKNIPREQWNQYLSAMFGEEAAVAIGPMMQNTAALRENFERIGDPVRYADSMLKEFESRSATTSNALTLMGNAGRYVATALGSPLLEPIRELSLEVVQAAHTAGIWMEKNKPLVSMAVKLGSALMIGVIAFHALRIGATLALSPFLSLYKAWQMMRVGMLALNVAMKANPIGLIVTAIGAAATGFMLAYEKCETFRNAVDNAVSFVSDKIAGLAELLESVWNFLGKITGSAGDAVKAYSAMSRGESPGWASQEQMVAIESGDLNALALPGLASGGIVTGPTLAAIGEGSEPEAVIPLSRLSALLHQTGTGATSYQISFSPVINISGGADAYESVKRGMKEAQTDFRREFDRMMRDRERLSYA